MGVRDLIENAARRVLGHELTETAEKLERGDASIELLAERLAELELALDDEGWTRLTGEADTEFSRAGLRKISKLARLYWLKNPLIKRAVAIRAQYVFGQGVGIAARDEAVGEVVKAFLSDKKNLTELTSHQAQMEKESELTVFSNVFFVLFTHPATGHVRVRSIPMDEIEDVITNPDDARDPWYYKRVRTKRWFDLARGEYGSREEVSYHPDWRYKPKGGYPATIGGKPVAWSSPVYHVAVNKLSDMKFGVSDLYAAIDWAKAHKDQLADWATIVRAHSRFAWAMKPGGGKGAAVKGAAKLGHTRPAEGAEASTGTRTPPVGSTFVGNADMTPIKTAGAAARPEDARLLLLMVCAGTGIYEHYFGNPATGNLATASSMERPMELMFIDRQTLWGDVIKDMLDYAIDAAALAPAGTLQGVQAVNEYGESYVDTGDLDRHVEVDFPPLLTKDVQKAIAAIISAGTLDGKTPAGLDLKTMTRMLLIALGEDNVDTMIEDLFPEGWEDDRAAKALAMRQAVTPEADEDDDDPKAAKRDREAVEAGRALIEAIRGAFGDAA